MLNHKFQITNHSPSPDGLGPALLKKGGGPKQYQNTNVLNSKQFRLLGFRILNLFGAWNLVLEIYLRRNVAADPWSAKNNVVAELALLLIGGKVDK